MRRQADDVDHVADALELVGVPGPLARLFVHLADRAGFRPTSAHMKRFAAEQDDAVWSLLGHANAVERRLKHPDQLGESPPGESDDERELRELYDVAAEVLLAWRRTLSHGRQSRLRAAVRSAPASAFKGDIRRRLFVRLIAALDDGHFELLHWIARHRQDHLDVAYVAKQFRMEKALAAKLVADLVGQGCLQSLRPQGTGKIIAGIGGNDVRRPPFLATTEFGRGLLRFVEHQVVSGD